MRLLLVLFLALGLLRPFHCQSDGTESTTSTEETTSTKSTTTPFIFIAPPVETSDKTDQPILDFSIVGEDSIESDDEVISGVFMIYADIDQLIMQSGDIDILVRETLGKVCKHFNSDAGAPTLSKMYVDAKTLGTARLGMNYTFQLLPPVAAGKDCVNRLTMVSFGPNEPPYEPLAPPPIRALMRTEMTAYGPTRDLDMTNWYLSVQNMSCDLRKVIKYWNHTTSADVFPTESPECLGGQSIDWKPNLKGEFMTEKVGDCPMAGGDACLCAALPGCEWMLLVGGERKCVWTASPGVDCDSCIYQEKCVMTPQKLCASRSTPCTCVLAGGDCVWSMSNSSCRHDPTGTTPCIACPRQAFCERTSVVRTEPGTFSILGSEQASYSWFINVTFDRRMEFRYSGLGSGVSLACRIRFPGDTSITFELDYSRLAIVDNILYVNCKGLISPHLRDCDLIIQTNSLRSSAGLLPYDGMQPNNVLVSLPDTLSPTCIDFWPKNSARSIPLNVTIILTFSEKLSISKNIDELVYTAIGIIRLGGNISDPESDTTVANISILDETRVTLDHTILMLNLEGLLEFSQYYSITLPGGVLVDQNKNEYGGMGRAKYVFLTLQTADVEEIVDPDKESFNYTWILSVTVGSLVLVVALYLGYKFYKDVRSKNRRANVMAADNTPKFITTVQDDGTLKTTAPEPQKFVHEDGDDDWSDQNRIGSLTRSPSRGVSAVAEFMQRSDRPQVQIIAKPGDPKVELRSQLRRAGTMPSLAEQADSSLGALKRMAMMDGGSSGFPSPTSERRTPKWTPTHQATSPHMSPKSDRRGRLNRGATSSSLSARGAMSPTSPQSARDMKRQSSNPSSPKSVYSPPLPNQVESIPRPSSADASMLRPE